MISLPRVQPMSCLLVSNDDGHAIVIPHNGSLTEQAIRNLLRRTREEWAWAILLVHKGERTGYGAAVGVDVETGDEYAWPMELTARPEPLVEGPF